MTGGRRKNFIGEPDEVRGRWLAEWRARHPEAHDFEVEWDEDVGVPVPTARRGGPRCGAVDNEGRVCRNPAGARTIHRGVGKCWRHNTSLEQAAGAWMVAHKIAQVTDVSPWEALLLAVKRAAAWAAFYDEKLGEVETDEDLKPGGSAYHWVEAAERVNEKLARWSKMAVDAGVARMLVERAQTEGALIARVLNSALAEISLDEDQEQQLRGALRRALEAMETQAVSSSVAGNVVGDGTIGEREGANDGRWMNSP